MASYQLDVISLPSHTPYAHKIWTQSDPKFQRYKTNRDLTFDLHLHSQDGLISTWCYDFIWLAGKYSICITNLSSIGPMVPEIQNNGDLTFDPNLHSQDGLISTSRYYVICLAGHTPYTYKIWAQSDQWLMRYSTMEIWPLTLICITKMASYQLDLIM